MMLAFYLHTLSPFIIQFGSNGIGLRWYGFAYVLSLFCGYSLYHWLARRGYCELKPEQVGDFITWAAMFGVLLGGRVGWVLFYGWSQDHSGDPWFWPLEVWKGGMASHGGILGLVLFTLFYARKHSVSWTSIGDNLCVVAPIGLFMVRVANFINGELYGHVTNVAWAVQFPKELYDNPELSAQAEQQLQMPYDSIIEQSRRDPHVQEVLRAILPPRHPSQIYEALLEGVVLFCALWFLRTKTRQPRGVLTGAFFIFYALLRIAGEVFRVPDAPLTVGLSRGQFLSLF